jgi:hypothetical protein
MNELAMNLATGRVDYGYLKVLIVGLSSKKRRARAPQCAIASAFVLNSIPTYL